MPGTLLLIRVGRQPSAGLSALMLLTSGLMLAGCSGGDFGRSREDFRNDDMHRWLGAEVTGSVGMKASQFQLTDGERQLRDQAYPVIAFASCLEGRVRRLPGCGCAMAGEGRL
jgi:hypothetical protein